MPAGAKLLAALNGNAATPTSPAPVVASTNALTPGQRLLANLNKSTPGGEGGILHMADGGSVNPITGWRERMAQMPAIERSSANNSTRRTLGNVLQGAAPTVAGEIAKPYLKDALGAGKDAIGRGLGEARNLGERALGVDQTQPAAELIDKSTQVADLASEAGNGIGSLETGGGIAAAEETAAQAAAAQLAAETAAAEGTAAAATTAAEGAVAANAWNPVGWVGAGLLAASALRGMRRADGGSVDRRDLRGGGRVAGPGTETSDSVPAQLSDGEFVLNAEAVKMIGKGRLEELNNKGLRQRRDADKPQLARALVAERGNIKKGLRNYG